MKHFFLLAFVCSVAGIFAQPVINSNVIAPVGAVTTYLKSGVAATNNFNPGAAGANVTWNFATLDTSLGASVQYTVPADTTYYYSEYPSVVNRAVGGWTGLGPAYAYTYIDNSKYEYYGTRSFSDFKIYQDPQKQLTFPFTYSNQFTDTFYDEYPVFYGNVAVKADAYGTLVLPTGTYSNVLRIYTREVYREYDENSPQDSLFYEGKYYRWYQPNTPNVLLEYASVVQFYIYQGQRYDADSIKRVSITKNPTITSIAEPVSFATAVYPNPAGNTLMINAETYIDGVTLTDLCGKTVLQQNFYDKNIQLNLENIAAGAYCLQLTTTDNRQKTGKIIHY